MTVLVRCFKKHWIRISLNSRDFVQKKGNVRYRKFCRRYSGAFLGSSHVVGETDGKNKILYEHSGGLVILHILSVLGRC